METGFVGIETLNGFHVQQKQVNVTQGGVDVYTFLSEDSKVIAAAENGFVYFLDADYDLSSAPKWVRAIIDCWEK